jgi:hypothetical protein
VAAGPFRYIALATGHATILERVAPGDGRVLSYRYLGRQVGIPRVALDGSGGGLSADGKTLVLSGPRTGYPARRSTLYFINPRTLALAGVLHLKGDFSFDAIAPDGATIYLIQLSPRDPTRYAVRALDTATGRLYPKPVVDAREPDEPMRGSPMTRATSVDGALAYTLYSGGDETFIHALDTMHRQAACIDIPPIRNLGEVHLAVNGHEVTVLNNGTPVAYVNTATRKVSKAPPATPPPAVSDGRGGGGGLPLWPFLAAAAAGLAGVTALGARRRRAGSART